MSLVNDMLRDLDQRRKQSSGTGGATSSLTPVPETLPEKAQQPVYIYLVLAILLGGAAIAWFWLQQDGTESTRQLDISPNVVVQPATSGSDTSQIETADSASAPVVPPSEGQAITAVALNGAAQDSGDTAAEQQASRLAEVSNTDSEVIETAANRQNPAASQDANNSSANNTLASRGSSSDVSGPTGNSQNPLVANRGNSSSELALNDAVDLTAPPGTDVKSDSVLSPEERDVMAVQEALRLIANNQLTGAYQILEQQVIDNRYAHQSRETYAKLLLNEGNLRGAYELVESGLGLTANHTGFKKIKARILIASGELDEAVSLLIARAPEVSRDLEYHDILATAQLASRDYQGALISYTELVQQDQNQGKWWYGFAASQDLLGNTNAARQGYSQAVSLPNLSANLRRRSQERLASLD